MSRWTPVTIKDDPTAHIRTDVLPFVLTPAEKSIAAQAAVQLERNRRKQNEIDALKALATWTGEMHRSGETF